MFNVEGEGTVHRVNAWMVLIKYIILMLSISIGIHMIVVCIILLQVFCLFSEQNRLGYEFCVIVEFNSVVAQYISLIALWYAMVHKSTVSSLVICIYKCSVYGIEASQMLWRIDCAVLHSSNITGISWLCNVYCMLWYIHMLLHNSADCILWMRWSCVAYAC